MEVTPSFWSKKKVCITGITGFKGSWLALLLKHYGAEILGISLEAEDTSLFSKLKLEKHFESQTQDIRNFEGLKQKVDQFKPDIVFHLAAQSLVRESYHDPVGTFSTNVQGTVHLLEVLRLNQKIPTLVVVTTDKCYENLEAKIPFKETDSLGGHDPYSASKGACEIATVSYIRSFFSHSGQGVATARAGNVIGGGDFAKDRIIPDIFRALVGGYKLQMRYPKSIRPWQHVLEPLSGYVLLAEKLHLSPQKYSQAWNFGPKEELSVNVGSLVENFYQKWGSDANYGVSSDSHPHEAETLRLDCTKAKGQLGWDPILSFDETIQYTVDWYKNYIKNSEGTYRFTEMQIRDYLNKRNSLCNVVDARQN